MSPHEIKDYSISVGEISEWSKYLDQSLRIAIKAELRKLLFSHFKDYEATPFTSADLAPLTEAFSRTGDIPGALHSNLVSGLLKHLGSKVGLELDYDPSPYEAILYCSYPPPTYKWKGGAWYALRDARRKEPWVLRILEHNVPMYMNISWTCPGHEIVSHDHIRAERELLELKEYWLRMPTDKQAKVLQLARS